MRSQSEKQKNARILLLKFRTLHFSGTVHGHMSRGFPGELEVRIDRLIVFGFYSARLCLDE